MIRPRPTVRSRRAGLSLFEVLVATGLVGSLLGTMTLLAQKASSTTVERAASLEARRSLEAVLTRVTNELKDASPGTLNPDPVDPFWVDAIDFQVVSALNAGGVTLSGVRRLELVEDPMDPANGVDDDGNGIVDEHVLQLTLEEGQTVTLSSHVRALGEGEEENGDDDDGDGLVDEPGFCVTRDGTGLRIEITLERVDGNGESVIASGEARKRNRRGVSRPPMESEPPLAFSRTSAGRSDEASSMNSFSSPFHSETNSFSLSCLGSERSVDSSRSFARL